MTVPEFIAQVRSDFDRHPPQKAVENTVGEVVNGVSRRLGGRLNYGTPHWERGDWDVLVLLDACRFDLMLSAAGDRPWLPRPQPHISPASMSAEFVDRMTQPQYRDEMADTALVTGNPFSRDLDTNRWHSVDEVWRHSWNDENGTILPRDVTDAAIRQHRSGGQDQMIVWYMQPHVPFLGVDWSEGYPDRSDVGKTAVDTGVKSPWQQLRDDELPFDTVWRAYRENLDRALDSVRTLLENVDGTVVISSDHANAVGEFGVYGHPQHSWVPSLKSVPWIELEATDEKTHIPDEQPGQSATDVESQLEALGYK